MFLENPNMLTSEFIQSAVNRLVGVAHSPGKVILFGSYARGDAHESSDIDLLVVEDEAANMADEYDRLPLSEFERRRDW